MTIRHVIAWKLGAADPADRAAHADQIADRLRGLVGTVPSIRALSVGAGVVDGNWDLALVTDFDDLAGLDEYQNHPAHLEVVAFVRPLVAERAAVDFEV